MFNHALSLWLSFSFHVWLTHSLYFNLLHLFPCSFLSESNYFCPSPSSALSLSSPPPLSCLVLFLHSLFLQSDVSTNTAPKPLLAFWPTVHTHTHTHPCTLSAEWKYFSILPPRPQWSVDYFGLKTRTKQATMFCRQFDEFVLNNHPTFHIMLVRKWKSSKWSLEFSFLILETKQKASSQSQPLRSPQESLQIFDRHRLDLLHACSFVHVCQY